MKEVKGTYGSAKIFTDIVEKEAEDQVVKMLSHEITKGTKVRMMPDIHAGKGATIGTTIKLPENFEDWKVCPNVVGVDVGCFTGDTKVKLLDGRSLSFLDLIEEDKSGKENFIFGVNKKGEIKISKLELPRKIDTVNTLAFVTLDNGEVVKCTLDHNFILRDGTEVEAQNLKVGESLMPLYIKTASEVSEEERGFKLERTTKGMGKYLTIYNPSEEKYEFLHFLADKYNEEKHPEIKDSKYDGGRSSFVRHHKDYNKENNNPTNIQRMGYKEHWEHHSRNVNKTNELGLTGFKRVAQLDPTIHSRAGKARAEATWRGPNAKANREKFRKLTKERNASGNLNSKEQRENSRQRQLTNNTNKFKEQNKDPNFITLQKAGKYSNMVKYCVNHFNEVNEENWEKARTKLYKNSLKYDSLLEFMSSSGYNIEYLLKHKKNHKVVNVEIKNVEPTDVYCLTNFEHGNFALDAGVFVKNCGMMFYKLANKNVDLAKLDRVVNKKIPSGFSVHEKPKMEETIRELISNLSFKLGEKAEERIVNSLGTLGGGNHFIEMGVDEEGFYWLAVHSGSRNLGTQVAGVHQEIAMKLLEANQDNSREIIEQLKIEGRHREISQVLKEYKENHKALTKEDLDLAFLTGDLLKDYLSDMVIAQKFAELSRMTMLNIISEEMRFSVIDKFDSVHNFIEHDNFTNGIIRKGATSAKDGERLVIPLNMRDGSIICIGRGNEDWNESAPHGAGRIMSRSKASRELKMEDFKEQMKGIYSSSIMEFTLDEAPEAYKPAQSILDNIKDTADVLHLVKPVYNFKAHEEKKEWKK